MKFIANKLKDFYDFIFSSINDKSDIYSKSNIETCKFNEIKNIRPYLTIIDCREIDKKYIKYLIPLTLIFILSILIFIVNINNNNLENNCYGKINIEDINEQLISDNLYTAGEPDPDLLIRTSGELRTSNFLPWQIVYSEFVFVEKNWPDFEEKDLDEAIEIYQKRNRKFGAK